jgi:hypothetical protein
MLTGFNPSLCFLCHLHTTTFLLIYHVMLCVFLTNFSRDFGILCTSLLFPWYLMYLPSSFFLSFVLFRILEYFLEILCMKILLCLCVGLILIYLGHLDCDLRFCNTWASN